MGWVLDFTEDFTGALTAKGAAFGSWTQLEVFSSPSLKRDGNGVLVADTPGSFASWLRRTTNNADKYKVSMAMTAWDTTQSLNEAILSIRSANSLGAAGMLTAYNVRLLAGSLLVYNINTSLGTQNHTAAMANGDLPFATVEVAPGTTGTTNLTAKAWKGSWANETSPISTVSLSNEATGPQSGGAVAVGHNGSARLSPSWGITEIRGYVWVDDTTAPVISGIQIQTGGTTARVTFTEAGSPPVLPASGMTGVTITGLSGGAVTLSGGTRITDTTADFTLSRTVYQNETGGVGAYASGNITDSATPPNSMASASNITVTNSSTQPQPASLSIAPTSAAIFTSGTQQFTATPTQGTLPDVIIWSVVGGAGNGTVTSGGLYTAPATPGTYTVQAQRTNHPSVVATATVTVTIAPPTGSKAYLVLTQQAAFATTGNTTGAGLSSTLAVEVKDFASSSVGTAVTIYSPTITEPYPGLYALRFLSPADLSKCAIFLRDPASGIVAALEAVMITGGDSAGSSVLRHGTMICTYADPAYALQDFTINQGEDTWVESRVVDEDGNALPLDAYTLTATLTGNGFTDTLDSTEVVQIKDSAGINIDGRFRWRAYGTLTSAARRNLRFTLTLNGGAGNIRTALARVQVEG